MSDILDIGKPNDNTAALSPKEFEALYEQLPLRKKRQVIRKFREIRRLHHAHAFFDLEDAICNCANMAGITAELILGCKTVNIGTQNDDEEAAFAVFHLCDMVSKLRQQYYELFEGKGAPAGKLEVQS